MEIFGEIFVDTLVKDVFLVVFPLMTFTNLTKRFFMVLVSHDRVANPLVETIKIQWFSV